MLQSHANSVTSLAITFDGKSIVSGSKDYSVRVWNLQEKRQDMFKAHVKTVFR